MLFSIERLLAINYQLKMIRPNQSSCYSIFFLALIILSHTLFDYEFNGYFSRCHLSHFDKIFHSQLRLIILMINIIISYRIIKLANIVIKWKILKISSNCIKNKIKIRLNQIRNPDSCNPKNN